MPKPTTQSAIVAWLEHAGCKQVKRLTGCIVLQEPGCGFWYIGTAGSTRYGWTRAGAYPAPQRFVGLTGRGLDCVRQSKQMPGPTVASLDI